MRNGVSNDLVGDVVDQFHLPNTNGMFHLLGICVATLALLAQLALFALITQLSHVVQQANTKVSNINILMHITFLIRGQTGKGRQAFKESFSRLMNCNNDESK